MSTISSPTLLGSESKTSNMASMFVPAMVDLRLLGDAVVIENDDDPLVSLRTSQMPPEVAQYHTKPKL
jgi:hypothetical protein